jgi:hypothetical protein
MPHTCFEYFDFLNHKIRKNKSFSHLFFFIAVHKSTSPILYLRFTCLISLKNWIFLHYRNDFFLILKKLLYIQKKPDSIGIVAQQIVYQIDTKTILQLILGEHFREVLG